MSACHYLDPCYLTCIDKTQAVRFDSCTEFCLFKRIKYNAVSPIGQQPIWSRLVPSILRVYQGPVSQASTFLWTVQHDILNQSKMVKVHAFTSVQYDISLNDDEWPGERTGSICVKFSWWGPSRRLDWFVGLQNRCLAHTTVCCDSVVCLCPWFASYCELDKSTIPVKSAENDVHSCIRSFILGLKFTSRELKACVFQTFMRVVLKSLDIKRSNTFDTFITKKMIMDVTHARSL